jgi:hypothetical protein
VAAPPKSRFTSVRARTLGPVNFTYEGCTIYLAQGMDEAEGHLILDRLKRRLPRSAMDANEPVPK